MTSADVIRVLVVDDSAFARKVLREALRASTGIEVVGIARDGLEALEKIAELMPDVVCLDLVMPNLDGPGVLRALPLDGPAVVVVSISDGNSALGAEALQLGAVDIVHKPTALATDRLYDLSAELVRKVKAAAHVRRQAVPAPRGPLPGITTNSRVRLIVIGTSTGGPQALTSLLATLPSDLPCAVAVALHIPAGYTEALARRLNEVCAVSVTEARHGQMLVPGCVVIAPGGAHLRITAHGPVLTAQIGGWAASVYTPSVNALFESAAAAVGDAALGVVMTGMGDDGAAGSLLLLAAGSKTLTEAESSCAVYGMPRAVVEAGASFASAPLAEMGELILQHL